MKKYHKKNPHDNIWILGLPAGAPPQAVLSLLPKSSKITKIILPERTKEDEESSAKYRLMNLPEL